MLKIEIKVEGTSRTVKVIGDLRAAELDELLTHLEGADNSVTTLDLSDLKIVDLSAIRFFIECEHRGIRIVASPPYMKEWMTQEGARKKPG
jgi:hypothetical protein